MLTLFRKRPKEQNKLIAACLAEAHFERSILRQIQDDTWLHALPHSLQAITI